MLLLFKRVVRIKLFPVGSTCCEAQTRLCEEQHMFSNNGAGVSSSAGSEADSRCAKVIFKVFLAVTQIFLLFSHLRPSAQGLC